MTTQTRVAILGLALSALLPTSARTEVQTTGTPGSPSATTTIDGKQLPPPDPKFGGVIKETAPQSKAWWAPRIVPEADCEGTETFRSNSSGGQERGAVRSTIRL